MLIPAHILAGISDGWRHRMELRRILTETPVDTSIGSLDPARLKAAGIAALALDFDGVLANHGAPAPLPEAIEWLERCQECFGGERIFILSNKPTEGRRSWFGQRFPAFRFVSGVAKKPFPDGVLTCARLAGVDASAVLMVDDRLLTGCLAALNAGAVPCYIRRPYIALQQRPLAELFFWLLRRMERLLLRF